VIVLSGRAGDADRVRSFAPAEWLRVDSNHRPHDYESCTGCKRRRSAVKPGQGFPCKSAGSVAWACGRSRRACAQLSTLGGRRSGRRFALRKQYSVGGRRGRSHVVDQRARGAIPRRRLRRPGEAGVRAGRSGALGTRPEEEHCDRVHGRPLAGRAAAGLVAGVGPCRLRTGWDHRHVESHRAKQASRAGSFSTVRRGARAGAAAPDRAALRSAGRW
jgi:hypothetical protein